jgi:acyl-CoA thioester hydrolase
MAGLFEEGRGRFNRSLDLHHGDRSIRWLVAAVALNYLAEAHHPNDVTVTSGIGHIGTRSWTILSGAFQNGVCVATCDTTLVYTDATGSTAFPASFRPKLEAMAVKPA